MSVYMLIFALSCYVAHTIAQWAQHPNAGYWHASIQSFPSCQPLFRQKVSIQSIRPDLSERRLIVLVLGLLALQKAL